MSYWMFNLIATHWYIFSHLIFRTRISCHRFLSTIIQFPIVCSNKLLLPRSKILIPTLKEQRKCPVAIRTHLSSFKRSSAWLTKPTPVTYQLKVFANPFGLNDVLPFISFHCKEQILVILTRAQMVEHVKQHLIASAVSALLEELGRFAKVGLIHFIL